MSRNRIDCSESIEYLQHALGVMETMITLLENSVRELIATEPTLNSIQRIYSEFQEVYDLYFFTYLGHFLRKDHHQQQAYIRNKKLVDYKVMQCNNKPEITQNYFWEHCATYLNLIM